MSIRKLNYALQKKAIDELNEDPKRVQDDIKHIKEWLAQQPHLKARTDDQIILNFLRGSKFNQQKTKERLDVYYTTKLELSQHLSNRDPFLPEIQAILDLGMVLPLPKTVGDDGPRIILLRFGGDIQDKLPESIKKSLLKSALKVGSMFLDIVFNEDDNFVIGGHQLIIDTDGVTIQQALALLPKLMGLGTEMVDTEESVNETKNENGKKPSGVKKDSIEEASKSAVNAITGNLLTMENKQMIIREGVKKIPKILPLIKKANKLLKKGLPSRGHRWDFINSFPMWNGVYDVSKQILNEEYFEKMFVHEDQGDLYQTVPLSVLPVELGGQGGLIQEIKDYWKTKVESYKDWFWEDDQYHCNESLRPKKVENREVENRACDL